MANKFIERLYGKSKIYVKAYLINLQSRLRGIYKIAIKFIKFYRPKMSLAQKLNFVLAKAGYVNLPLFKL